MKDGFSKTLLSKSPDETQRLASLLAPGFGPGDTVLLYGEIGAGKSHFARSFIQARLAAGERSEDIPSPTYTLVQTYFDGIADIWHADLYRLSDTSEIIELGLPDAFQDAICLVEWPDQLGEFKPETALHIHFDIGEVENQRRLTFSAALQWCEKLLPVIQNKAHV